MASKAATAADTAETREDAAESPLLDTIAIAIKKMVARGKERGYLTYDELNAALPTDQVSPDQIEDTMTMLSELGINLIEREESEEPAEAEAEEGESEAGGGRARRGRGRSRRGSRRRTGGRSRGRGRRGRRRRKLDLARRDGSAAEAGHGRDLRCRRRRPQKDPQSPGSAHHRPDQGRRA